MDVGAVGALKDIRNAILVARHVLENTRHTFLVGRDATNFAVQMGLRLQTLTTSRSTMIWSDWRNNKCQPNYWIVSRIIIIIY